MSEPTIHFWHGLHCHFRISDFSHSDGHSCPPIIFPCPSNSPLCASDLVSCGGLLDSETSMSTPRVHFWHGLHFHFRISVFSLSDGRSCPPVIFPYPSHSPLYPSDLVSCGGLLHSETRTLEVTFDFRFILHSKLDSLFFFFAWPFLSSNNFPISSSIPSFCRCPSFLWRPPRFRDINIDISSPPPVPVLLGTLPSIFTPFPSLAS